MHRKRVIATTIPDLALITNWNNYSRLAGKNP